MAMPRALWPDTDAVQMPLSAAVAVVLTVLLSGLGVVFLGTHGAPASAAVLAVVAVVAADLPARFAATGRFDLDSFRAQVLTVTAVVATIAVAVDLRP